MPTDWRVDPFTDNDQSVLISDEAHTVPGSSPYYVALDEIPRQDTPSSILVKDTSSTTTATPSADAWVYEGSPSTNYGSQAYGQIGRDSAPSSYRHRFLLTFNIASLPSNADSCKLRVYQNAIGSSGYPLSTPVGVHQVTGTWSGGSVTWATQPAYNAVAAGTANITNSGLYDIDITALYNAWKAGSITNYGVILIHGNENGGSDSIRQFASVEDSTSSHRPCLCVVSNGASYTEVARQVTPGAGQFAVNYERGYLRFNSAQAGTNILVDYYGRGTPIRA